MKKVIAVAVLLVLAAGSSFAFTVGDSLILEARDATGAVNPCWAPTVGTWALSDGKSTAEGLTGFGCEYASTYSSIVGLKESAFTADIPADGLYEVFTTYRATSLNRNPILYRVDHRDGTAEMDIDQSINGNTWVSLGNYWFDAGTGTAVVTLSNAHVDLSGNMWADSVKFTMVEAVPEPSSILALVSGLAGMAGFVIRRRKA